MTPTSFVDLPNVLQDKIYNYLPVCDKARFRMAMPKPMGNNFKLASYKDKGLGMLSKAIKKKKIVEISDKVKHFLKESVSEFDPTIEEMQSHIPSIKECFNKIHVAMHSNMTYPDICRTISSCGTDTNVFNQLRAHPSMSYDSDGSSLMSILLNYNTPLFKVVLKERLIDVNACKMNIARSVAIDRSFIQIIFEVVSYSLEEMSEMQLFCLNNCYFRSAELIEKLVNGHAQNSSADTV